MIINSLQDPKIGLDLTTLRNTCPVDMNMISSRFYIALFFLLFAVSTTILLFASTAPAPISAWGGYVDVVLVILIVFIGFTIYQHNKNVPRYDTSYQVAIYLFPLLVLGIWIYRSALDFNLVLPGVAWRIYCLLSILPHAITLWISEQHQ